MISDFVVLLVGGIGQSDKEFTTGVGVEVCRCVTFDPSLVPNLRLFSLSVYLRNYLVKITLSIHRLPERLSVGGVSSSRIILLSAIVDKRNTSSSKRKNCSVSELCFFTTIVVQETRIVVIVNKNSKCVNILEVGRFGIIPSFNLIHSFSTTKDISNSIVHGIVKQRCQTVLVGTNICWVAIEAFAHLENT